jgi:CYTH domain-containing protein
MQYKEFIDWFSTNKFDHNHPDVAFNFYVFDEEDKQLVSQCKNMKQLYNIAIPAMQSKLSSIRETKRNEYEIEFATKADQFLQTLFKSFKERFNIPIQVSLTMWENDFELSAWSSPNIASQEIDRFIAKLNEFVLFKSMCDRS